MKDKDIEGTITRNSNIPESLGRIQYLLTDKTGTLEQASFQTEDLCEMKQIINDQILVQPNRPASHRERDRDTILKDLILALAVCHNVTPLEGGNFQASSPDEIALVKFACVLGLELEKRDQNNIVV
jgi:phospholipid-translocating ATPase